MPNTLVNHFLNSLITLTKERNSDELEQQLLKTLHKLCMVLGCEHASVDVYRLKDIAGPLHNALSDDVGINDERAFFQSLIDSYNTSSYRLFELKDQQSAHMFPLKNDVAYLNTVVVVKVRGKMAHDDVIGAIAQLLSVYQNYTVLMNDNERDTLTGLFNRKTFDYKFHHIAAQLAQPNMRIEDRKVSAHYLAMFDIDHFKKVNDVHGHLIGDEVLLLFSQLMSAVFRETDPLFRFGGEEFVCLFSCAQVDDIAVLLDRFRKRLSEYQFPQVGHITVSIGCAMITGGLAPTEYVEMADAALYYAKNHGRDRVCYYETLIEQGLLEEAHKESDVELF